MNDNNNNHARADVQPQSVVSNMLQPTERGIRFDGLMTQVAKQTSTPDFLVAAAEQAEAYRKENGIGLPPSEYLRFVENKFFDAFEAGDEKSRRKAFHALLDFERMLKRYTRRTREPLKLEFASDIANEPPPLWSVDGIIPESGIGAIYGPPKSFKSFVAMDLLAHIAEGQPWFGRRATKRPCVYIPFEGRSGLSPRFKAWELKNDRNIPFQVMRKPFNLRDQQSRDELVAICAQLERPVLEIDTLAAAAGSFDENSMTDMGAMIAILQELQDRLPGSLIVAVHHSGKDGSKGMRGHSSLSGAVDFALECHRGTGLAAGFETALAKDGPQNLKFAFEMEAVGASLVVSERHETTGEHDAKPTISEAEDIIVSHIREHKPFNQGAVITALTGKLGKNRIESIMKALAASGRIKKGAEGYYEVSE
jgi:hypothetical protein